MDLATLFQKLHERGLDFRAPGLLWGLLLVPCLLLAYAGARRARRRVAGAFSVTRPGAPRPRRPLALLRVLSLALLLLGLAGLVVGFARPQVPMITPNDRATVVFIVDASIGMRSTDVNPTRVDAAKAAAKVAIAAVPDRLQVAVVAYSRAAYILQPPTHDHGAAAAVLDRIRTAEDAAEGDAIAVALATIPLLQAEQGASAAAPGGATGASGAAGGSGAPKVPAAIVLLGSGVNTAGRGLDEALAAARDAAVTIHVVPEGPRTGAEQKAPYDEAALRQIAQATGGRFLTAPSTRDWKQIFGAVGSAVDVELKPQEVGHFVGAGSLSAIALSMIVSLAATRRLV